MKTITELAQEIKNKFSEKKVIAPVESTSTASQAYAVGKKFFYNNILYKCTTAIAKNGSIVPGTNCTAADAVETQIDSIDTEVSNVKQALSNEVVTRSQLCAHNLAEPYTGYSLGTVDAVPYIEAVSNGVLMIAPIEANKSYIITKASVGDRFRVAGFNDIGFNKTNVRGVDIYNSDTATSYQFTNTVGYKYLVVALNRNTASVTVDAVQPMIRLATDADTTYRPYVPTNAQLLSADANAELGAHQLLDYDFDKIKARNTSGTWSGNTYSFNGLTFVVNNDLSITVSGTSTASSDFGFQLGFQDFGNKNITSRDNTFNKYIFSDGSPTSAIYLVHQGNNHVIYFLVNKTFSLPSGQSITLYPLVRLVSDPSTKFTPYAMTNRELMEYIARNNLQTAINISSYNSENNLYVAPSDGYVAMNYSTTSQVNESTLLVIYSSDNTNHLYHANNAVSYLGANMFTTSVFVKKGMRMFVNVAEHSIVTFNPLA